MTLLLSRWLTAPPSLKPLKDFPINSIDANEKQTSSCCLWHSWKLNVWHIYFSHLHPAISSVHILVANLKLVAALCNKVLHPFKELVVVTCAEKVTAGKEEVFTKQYFAIFSSFLVMPSTNNLRTRMFLVSKYGYAIALTQISLNENVKPHASCVIFLVALRGTCNTATSC